MKFKKILISSIVCASITAVSPTSSAAEEELEPSMEQYSEPEIVDGMEVSIEVEKEERGEFAEDQSRSGNLVDDANINVSELDTATVVWEENIEVKGLTHQKETIEGEEVEAFSLVTTNDPDAVKSDSPDTPATTMGQLIGIEGAATPRQGCATTKGAGEGNNRNQITSCWQKARIYDGNNRTHDFYIYNRWAKATGMDNRLSSDAKPASIDMRSRPATGTAKPGLLVDWTPRNGEKTCTASGSVGVGYGGFNASMPIQNCSGVTITEDATEMSIRADWSAGAFVDDRSEGVDASMIVRTNNDVEPVFADYTDTKFCVSLATNSNCTGFLIRKDPTWDRA